MEDELVGTYNIIARQGDRLGFRVTWTDDDEVPIDITGYTIRLQVREKIGSAAPFLDLDNGAKGGITITDAQGGEFEILVPATDMAAITNQSGVWDIEVVPGGDEAFASTLLRGRWHMELEVTR